MFPTGRATRQPSGIIRQVPAFRGGQELADPLHRAAGVVAPLAGPPQLKLLGEVAGRLARERRIGRADALSLATMAGCARLDPAGRIAFVKQGGTGPDDRILGRPGEAGVMEGDRLALARIEGLRDPRHLLMVPASVAICVELAFEIAGIESGKPGGARSVSQPVEAVAGEAGIGRTRARATERDCPPIPGEAVERRGLANPAARQQDRTSQGNSVAHSPRTDRRRRWFRLPAILPVFLLSVACKPAPDGEPDLPTADAARGREAIARAGCGSCHAIPGIGWPRGAVGPRLHGLAGRALIAGHLPNRPDLLAAYIRNAPALVPGSGMPAMPITDAEARDIAAYLYDQGGA